MSIGSSARLIQTIRDLSLFYFVLVLWNTSQMRCLLIAIVADKNQETLKKNYAFSKELMKTTIERNDDRRLRNIVASQDVPDVEDDQRLRRKISILWPVAMLSAMATAILLLDAVLPLRDFWFHEATLTQLGTWPAWPSLLLFPGWSIIAPVPFMHVTGTPDVLQSWTKLPVLLDAFLIVFVVYLVAVRRLPQYISWRYLWCSTVVLGILYMLIPAVTSPDLYSYIAYARIGVLYHLNPLTTIPTAIHSDVI